MLGVLLRRADSLRGWLEYYVPRLPRSPSVSFYTTCRQHRNISATSGDNLLYSGNVAGAGWVIRLMKLTSVTLDVLVGETITLRIRA